MNADLLNRENVVSYLNIDRAYDEYFPFEFRLNVQAHYCREIAEARDWCEEMWGPCAPRTWLAEGVVCPLEGAWNFLGKRFYFRTEAACVLFQLRWR